MSLDLQQPFQTNDLPFCIEMLDSKIFIPYKYILISRDNIRMQKSLCIPPEETDKPKQPEVWFLSNKFSILFEEWSIYLLTLHQIFLPFRLLFGADMDCLLWPLKLVPLSRPAIIMKQQNLEIFRKLKPQTLVLIKLELYTKDMIGNWVGG